MTAIANGHAPADVERLARELDEHDEDVRDGLRDVVLSLQQLLKDEQKARMRLDELLEESKTRERRITKALSDLTGETPAKTTTAATTTATKRANNWTPSDERVEHIRASFLAYMEEHPDQPEFTQTELARWMKERGEGVSSETIARSMAILREREVVRPAAKTRGGGTLWALMRNADDA